MLHDLNRVPAGIKRCSPTGSRYICDPPVLDTDEDYIVLVKDNSTYAQTLLDDGWEVTMHSDHYDGKDNGRHPFFTARKGELNLIIFSDVEGFELFELATTLAKKFNLTDREDRVALFVAICGDRYVQAVSVPKVVGYIPLTSYGEPQRMRRGPPRLYATHATAAQYSPVGQAAALYMETPE